MERHPYSPTPGGIAAALNQFRKSFPQVVNADTLRKLAIAPKNESYVINTLRFIGAIDKDGKQNKEAANIFYQGDPEFQKGFADMIKTAYKDLFALHQDATWTLPSARLIAFFRSTDKTSALVGKLQTSTFQLLAMYAGHAVAAEPASPEKPSAAPKPKRPKVAKGGAGTVAQQQSGKANERDRDIGLSVRIEVNLPAAGDQETYDRIFRSIRENLLNVPKA
jgi:Family of unknown function (DUF5343)